VGPKDECAYSSPEIKMKAHIHPFRKMIMADRAWGERGQMAFA